MFLVLKFNRGVTNVYECYECFYLCFFQYLAIIKSGNRFCETYAHQLFNEYCRHYNISAFNRVRLADFIDLEDLFKINIIIYQFEDTVAKLVQRSREIYDKP